MAHYTTREQVSAGGVAFRRQGGQVQVALISVGDPARWQLPKGLVGRDEAPEDAAQREVHEEAGVITERLDLIEKIEYWYFGKTRCGGRVRFHKHVYFFLFRYVSGDVADHDHEVNEARWVDLDQAGEMLAFANEKQVVAKARELIAQLGS